MVKDLLNLYLDLGNQVLRKEKITFKTVKKEEDTVEIIKNVMAKYNLSLLVENIRNLSDYIIFRESFESRIITSSRFDNIKYVFKDELLPVKLNEEYSLMNMSTFELTKNFHFLMHYILPDSEKAIYLSKE
ncbi:hypothetical protein DH26_gp082 [Chloriridovirus anopheles1]|uniref:Uncharacterized protein n=1 Tax=Chloriridovirus anopheles1 TaxID=1465751 RepID=W8QE53_9VIRU|nr:hypothetical protein DH26_gp082 [Anopheles minimus iridovirus]AHL67575.1 hypothetical protein AMIV_082 [Anopheles minimus iridovirus]